MVHRVAPSLKLAKWRSLLVAWHSLHQNCYCSSFSLSPSLAIFNSPSSEQLVTRWQMVVSWLAQRVISQSVDSIKTKFSRKLFSFESLSLFCDWNLLSSVNPVNRFNVVQSKMHVNLPRKTPGIFRMRIRICALVYFHALVQKWSRVFEKLVIRWCKICSFLSSWCSQKPGQEYETCLERFSERH